MSHLTDKQKINNLSKGFNSVVDLILLKHFDPDHPENSNIFIPSLKSTDIIIYDGKRWVVDNLHDVVYHLIDNTKSEIGDNFKELKARLPLKIKELCEHVLKNDNENVVKIQTKNVEQKLYNERDIPIKIKNANKTNKRLK